MDNWAKAGEMVDGDRKMIIEVHNRERSLRMLTGGENSQWRVV